MSSIDERIVKMGFENGEFEKGAKESIGTLEKLKSSLNFSGKNGLAELTESASKVDLSPIANGVEAIQDKFSVLSTVGKTIIVNLTNDAIGMFKRLSNYSIGGIFQGGWNRAQNIENAKFSLEGLGVQWEDIKDTIDASVKGTAYGFDEAANASAMFYASGVKLGDDMEKSLKAIAGVAAQTNSDYASMANIFTEVAGQGRLMGQQLMSLSYRGLNAAAILGKALNKSETEIRDMTSEGQISFKTFRDAMYDAFSEHAFKANETLPGVLNNIHSALARIGADVAQPTIVALVPMLNEVREAINDIHEGLRPILEYVTKLIETKLDRLAKQLNGVINVESLTTSSKIAVKALKSFVSGFENIGKTVKSVSAILKKSFDEAFPDFNLLNTITNVIGPKFVQITKGIADSLKPNGKYFDSLVSLAKGLFSILDTGVYIIVELAHALSPLKNGFKAVLDLFIDFNGLKGSIVSSLSDTVKSSSKLSSFMAKIYIGSLKLSTAIRDLTYRIREFSSGPTMEKFKSMFSEVAGSLTNFVKSFSSSSDMSWAERFQNGIDKIRNVFSRLWDTVQPILKPLVDSLKSIATTFKTQLGNLKPPQFLMFLVSGLFIEGMRSAVLWVDGLATRFRLLKQKLTDIEKVGIAPGRIAQTINDLRISSLNLITDLKAERLSSIAKAMIELAAAMWIISTIDSDKMASTLTGLGGAMFAMSKFFQSYMSILDTYMKGSALKGMGEGIFALIGISASILILAGAMETLGSMDWDSLLRGITGMGAAMAMLMTFMKNFGFGELTVDGAVFKTEAKQLVTLAAAMWIMAKAVQQFASLNWGELSRGLAGFGGALFALSKFANATTLTSGMSAAGKGIILIAASMVIFAIAFEKLGGLNIEELAKGLGTFAVVLYGLVKSMGSMAGMSANLATVGTTILGISISLFILTKALQILAGIDTLSLIKGVIALGAVLTELTIATMFMEANKGAAGTILLLSLALAVLVPQLMLLSTLNFGGIMAIFITLGGLLALLGAAAAFLTPLIPTISALSIAMLTFGGAIALVGLGVALLGTGLVSIGVGIASLVGGLAAAGITIADFVGGLISALLASLSQILDGLRIALVDIADFVIQLVVDLMKKINTRLPEIVKTACEMVEALLDAFIQELPTFITKVIKLLVVGMESLATAIEENKESIENAIVKLLSAILTLIIGLLPKVFEMGKKIVLNIIDGIKEKHGDTIKAVADIIKGIRDRFTEFLNSIPEIGRHIITGLINGLSGGVKLLWSNISGIGSGMVSRLRNILGIKSPSREAKTIGQFFMEGLEIGLSNGKTSLQKNVAGIGNTMTSLMNDMLSDIVQNDMDLHPTITPVFDTSNVAAGANAVASILGGINGGSLNANVGVVAKSMSSKGIKATNDDVVAAVNKLGKDISAMSIGDSININGITYDDGSNVANAVRTLVDAIVVERRK